MKRTLFFTSIALSLVALAIVGGGWITWRSEVRRLKAPESVADETGLSLPSTARITATKAHLFSLADGNNYEWLLQSDSSLEPWAARNMSAEGSGWEHVRQMSEFGFEDEIARDVKFGRAWRGFRRSSKGRDETSYLFLSRDGRLGVLHTFRP